jgi:hypothetical protein
MIDDADKIAAIANRINAELDTVFKNNSAMVATLAIAVFEASQLNGAQAATKMTDSEKQLEELRAYCRSAFPLSYHRAVYREGELVGYWFETEWLDRLLELSGGSATLNTEEGEKDHD